MGRGSADQQQTCRQFILRNCKARVFRVFPGEYLDSLVEYVIQEASAGNLRVQTARKLLFHREHRK